MSRFLNINKYSISVMLIVSCVSCIVGVIFNWIWYLGILAMVVYYGILRLNNLTIKKNIRQYVPFSSTSQIRNIDYLIVGDMCDSSVIVNKNKTFIQIQAPKRGVHSCYEIVRHTHSILKDGGTVCVCLNQHYINKPIGVFDIPFFHPVTIKRLCLQNINRWASYPMICRPLSAIILLLGIQSKRYVLCNESYREIDEFCSERGYTVQYWMKK